MFKLNLKNAHDCNSIHAVVRMNQTEYLSLRQYMNMKDAAGTDINFSYGVTLKKRGYGWYQLAAAKPTRATEKIAFARKIIRLWLKDEERKVDEALKFLMPTMMNATVRAVAYTSDAPNAFAYLGMPEKDERAVPVPASPQKLQALAARFGRPQP